MQSAPALGARFWSLIGATFLGFLGMGTVLPGLAPHIRHDLGGSDRTVGFVVGVFSFVALAFRLISGPLADRRGRKLAFLMGLLSCSLAGGAYLLPLGLFGPYLGRILQGMGEACLYTGAAAWIVEVAGIHRSARALGYLSSGIWGGVAAGPVVGAWLGSFQKAALLQLIAALVAFVVVARVPEEYQGHAHAGSKTWIPTRLIMPGITVGLVNVHYPVIAGFLILYLAQHGNSGPAAFSAYALTILLSRFFLGGLPDRIHPAMTYYVGVLIMAAGLGVIAIGPAPVWAVSSAAVLGFGFSFPWSSVLSTVLRSTPSNERGSAVGVLSAFYDLFVGASAFAAGLVANRFGYAAAFYMATAALGAAALAGRYVFKGQVGVVPEPAAVASAASPSGGPAAV